MKVLYQKWLSLNYRVTLKQNHSQQVWMESLSETFILLNRYFFAIHELQEQVFNSIVFSDVRIFEISNRIE